MIMAMAVMAVVVAQKGRGRVVEWNCFNENCIDGDFGNVIVVVVVVAIVVAVVVVVEEEEMTRMMIPIKEEEGREGELFLTSNWNTIIPIS